MRLLIIKPSPRPSSILEHLSDEEHLFLVGKLFDRAAHRGSKPSNSRQTIARSYEGKDHKVSCEGNSIIGLAAIVQCDFARLNRASISDMQTTQ
jgi:hypothetical protein